MNIWKTIADTAGDILGTSKLAKLNKNVFRPLVGTGITREEYEMCNGSEIFAENISKKDKRTYENMGNDKRSHIANKLLNYMVDNGTNFSDSRVAEFCSNFSSKNYEPALDGSVMSQMSDEGRKSLKAHYSHEGQIEHRLRTISVR